MAQVDFTLEDVKKVIDERIMAEREYTRGMVQEIIQKTVPQIVEKTVPAIIEEEVANQFNLFSNDIFDPAMMRMEQYLENIDDHLDRLDIDSAQLRTDMRHVKKVLRIDHDSIAGQARVAFARFKAERQAA